MSGNDNNGKGNGVLGKLLMNRRRLMTGVAGVAATSVLFAAERSFAQEAPAISRSNISNFFSSDSIGYKIWEGATNFAELLIDIGVKLVEDGHDAISCLQRFFSVVATTTDSDVTYAVNGYSTIKSYITDSANVSTAKTALTDAFNVLFGLVSGFGSAAKSLALADLDDIPANYPRILAYLSALGAAESTILLVWNRAALCFDVIELARLGASGASNSAKNIQDYVNLFASPFTDVAKAKGGTPWNGLTKRPGVDGFRAMGTRAVSSDFTIGAGAYAELTNEGDGGDEDLPYGLISTMMVSAEILGDDSDGTWSGVFELSFDTNLGKDFLDTSGWTAGFGLITELVIDIPLSSSLEIDATSSNPVFHRHRFKVGFDGDHETEGGVTPPGQEGNNLIDYLKAALSSLDTLVAPSASGLSNDITLALNLLSSGGAVLTGIGGAGSEVDAFLSETFDTLVAEIKAVASYLVNEASFQPDAHGGFSLSHDLQNLSAINVNVCLLAPLAGAFVGGLLAGYYGAELGFSAAANAGAQIGAIAADFVVSYVDSSIESNTALGLDWDFNINILDGNNAANPSGTFSKGLVVSVGYEGKYGIVDGT